MRKVAGWLFSSLDGVVEAPNEWQFDFDEQMGAALTELQQEQDTILLGRKTYTEWVGYWPKLDADSPDADYADWINTTPKYVFSSTLDSVDDWQNSTLVTKPAAEAIAELKNSEGGTIATAGSPTLVRSLVEQGLLDELVLLVHPVVAGGGRQKLFTDDAPLTKLKLEQATPTSSGVIITKYSLVQ